MKLIGNTIELDGVPVGFIVTDRGTALRVRDWFDSIEDIIECDHCDDEATVHTCQTCLNAYECT